MTHIHVMSHCTSNCAPVCWQCPAKWHILSVAKTACVHMETPCITVVQFSYTWASYMWSTRAHCEQLTPGQQWDGVITVVGQQLHKVKLPTASSYAWPAAVHGHVTHCLQLHMTNSCTPSCYALATINTWPAAVHGHVKGGQQLYTVMLYTADRYNHITWCQ